MISVSLNPLNLNSFHPEQRTLFKLGEAARKERRRLQTALSRQLVQARRQPESELESKKGSQPEERRGVDTSGATSNSREVLLGPGAILEDTAESFLDLDSASIRQTEEEGKNMDL